MMPCPGDTAFFCLHGWWLLAEIRSRNGIEWIVACLPVFVEKSTKKQETDLQFPKDGV